MNFLQYLDVIIGYAVAMMVLATLIGAASAIWISLIRTRTRHLSGGLASLLENLGVAGEQGHALANAIMMDRTVKARGIWSSLTDPTDWKSLPGAVIRWVRGFAAEPIQREELALIILRKAAEGNGAALKALGLPNATRGQARELLSKVETAMLLEEVEKPSLPAQTWRAKALADNVRTLAAPLFSHFDNLMDRVEDNVKASGKASSAVFAAVFLLAYPVSSFDILNRLSVSDELRQKVIAAGTNPNANDPLLQKGLFGDSLNCAKCDVAWFFKWLPPARWLSTSVAQAKCDYSGFFTPGVLLTWVMVSMGAPFWLSQLTRLLGLRSEIARRLEDQRTLRDGDQRTTI